MTGEQHFADGIDTPDRLAFGLRSAELVVVVAGLLLAYVLARSALPRPVGFGLALFLAALCAGLGWLRVLGRPSLDWAALAARYVVRAREGSLLIERAAGHAVPATPAQPGGRAEAVVRSDADGVLPLFGRPGESDGRRARRVVFFSLQGGTGRTTLSIELACWLATHGRRDAAHGAALRVALVDLDSCNPSVAMRLGIPQPVEPLGGRHASGRVRVVHRTGVHVVPGSTWTRGREHMSRAADVLASLDDDGFDVVVSDVASELDGATGVALQSAHLVPIVITPTPVGVHAAYRTAEALRRAGLRDRLVCVVNRRRFDIDLSETIGDLGLRAVAAVPEDPAVAAAENAHAVLSLDARTPMAAAMAELAQVVLGAPCV